MKNNYVKTIVYTAVIAAIYTALSVALAPISYGPVQFRISEALTLLPVLTPLAIPGLTLGCFLSNLIGMLMGANPVGWIDMIVGTAATLLAAIVSWALRRYHIKTVPVLAAIPPVIFNAVMVGLELTFLFGGKWYLNMLSVGFGELVVCFVLGLPLVVALERTGLAKKLFSSGPKKQE